MNIQEVVYTFAIGLGVILAVCGVSVFLYVIADLIAWLLSGKYKPPKWTWARFWYEVAVILIFIMLFLGSLSVGKFVSGGI